MSSCPFTSWRSCGLENPSPSSGTRGLFFQHCNCDRNYSGVLSRSVRTRLSQAYFPPFFFCVFAAFHVYIFSFPFGFTYLALWIMALMLLHLMLFFWNCFEMPALGRGNISVQTPRELYMRHA